MKTESKSTSSTYINPRLNGPLFMSSVTTPEEAAGEFVTERGVIIQCNDQSTIRLAFTLLYLLELITLGDTHLRGGHIWNRLCVPLVSSLFHHFLDCIMHVGSEMGTGSAAHFTIGQSGDVIFFLDDGMTKGEHW